MTKEYEDGKLKAPLSQSAVEGLVIKPCPFCGGNEAPKQYDKTPWNIFIEREGLQMALCDEVMGGCGMRFIVKAENLEEAISKLNKRAL